MTEGTAHTSARYGRDAVNDVYDHGCDLVQAAAALQRGADDAGTARAAPAVLGCIETALRDLTEATAALGRTTCAAVAEPQAGRAPERVVRREARMRKGFANVELALYDAADAAAAARSLAARALA